MQPHQKRIGNRAPIGASLKRLVGLDQGGCDLAAEIGQEQAAVSWSCQGLVQATISQGAMNGHCLITGQQEADCLQPPFEPVGRLTWSG